MQPYLDLMRHVRDHGVRKDDRTGTGTLSVFGHQMRFDLSQGFPLVTTKKVHTNTIENYFSVFKRGMRGTYQHCGEKHLHRYLAEFDFRYNNRIAMGVNDNARTTTALRGAVGKRLMYRDSSVG